MKALDLFSGIGGFSLGLERAGMTTVAFCEIDPFCRRVLAKHWPNVPCYHDIIELRGSDVGPVDVICGGFPCTQTSVAACIHGRRKGLSGKDSILWFDYFRLVQAIRPVWVIVENPIGIKKWESEVQGSLERIGYAVSKLEVKASDFGLPHIRKRYFYVANTYGKRLEIARQPKSQSFDWAKRLAVTGGAWLSSSPGTIGGFNGIPNRVDRCRVIGNSILPQISELIGRGILAL